MTCVRGTPGPLSDSDVIGEITSLRAENERLRAEIARLRGALEAVEWVQEVDSGESFCPWCDNNKLVGHHADCQRQAALDAAGVEG